uniref:Uncharacterized protein n=1 Tax=Knipowitschia caucasica TaxID=637954 RepID=A0AAV2LA96_KNICA
MSGPSCYFCESFLAESPGSAKRVLDLPSVRFVPGRGGGRLPSLSFMWPQSVMTTATFPPCVYDRSPASPRVLGVAGFRRSFRLSRRDKKTNKTMYECKKSELYDTADVPTYEEVTWYCRPPGARHRLVNFYNGTRTTPICSREVSVTAVTSLTPSRVRDPVQVHETSPKVPAQTRASVAGSDSDLSGP